MYLLLIMWWQSYSTVYIYSLKYATFSLYIIMRDMDKWMKN